MKHLDYKRFNGFCGVANLANVLRDEVILDFLDNDEFIPSGYKQLTKILNKIGWPDNLVVEPMVQLFNGMELSKELTKDIIMSDVLKIDDESFMPFILNVRLRKSDKFTHAVSVLRFNDFLLYSDPINQEYVKLQSIDELFDHFEVLLGIWVFQLLGAKSSDDDEICCFKLRHLFNELISDL